MSDETWWGLFLAVFGTWLKLCLFGTCSVWVITFLCYLLYWLVGITLSALYFAFSLVLAAFALVCVFAFLYGRDGEGFDLAYGVQLLAEKCAEWFPRALWRAIQFVHGVKTGEVDQRALHAIQELFDATYADRAYQGEHNVSRLTVQRATWVRNPKVYKEYVSTMAEITSSCDGDNGGRSRIMQEPVLGHNADTSFIAKLGWGPLLSVINPKVNEALLFHATSNQSAMQILEDRVRVASTAAIHGELYGVGTYFAESVSKADTYARSGPNGVCGMIVSRVTLGNMYTTTEKKPQVNVLSRQLRGGGNHSICGDRRNIVGYYGGWREFITDRPQQSMPLLLVWYTRND